MIEIVRLLARKMHSWESTAEEAELCAARDRLQNALDLLERTLESMDHNALECAHSRTSTQSS